MNTKLLLAGVVVGLALVGMPVEELSVAPTASAVMCNATDVDCHVWRIQNCMLPDPEDPHLFRVCPA